MSTELVQRSRNRREQIAFCVGEELFNGPLLENSALRSARESRSKRLCCTGAFTTFYNHLRWLDNSSREVF